MAFIFSNQRILVIFILALGMATSLLLVLNAVAAVNPFDFTYPIAELNNCKDQAACKAVCDNPENAEACLSFAKKHGLISEEEAVRTEKLSGVKNGPGGCNSQSTCEAYCNSIDHIDECLSFGEQHGLMDKNEIAEANKIREAMKRGARLPGGCRDKKSCEAYCSDPTRARECIAFAKEAGIVSEEEINRVEKFLPLMERGETPGGCRNKDVCESYCSEENHMDECIAFAEKVGAISEKEKEMIRKTGGKGPGGCRGRQCEAFCKNPANQRACFEFAKENGLISSEELGRMEEGKKHLRQTLGQAPPEVKECLSSVLGPDGLVKIESGEFFGGPELGEKMRGCFEKMMKFGPPTGIGPEGLPQGGGFRGPGGCASKAECEAYCEEHEDECSKFGEDGARGGPELIGPPAEIERGFRDGQPQLMQGGPGGCRGPEECQKYCSDPEHRDDCARFNPTGGGMPPGSNFIPGSSGSEGFRPPEGFMPTNGGGYPSPKDLQKYQQQYEEQFRQPQGQIPSGYQPQIPPEYQQYLPR